MDKLLNKVWEVFQDSTYCGWGLVYEELEQALIDSKKKIEDYKQAWEHHYNLTQELQSKLDKIMATIEKTKYCRKNEDDYCGYENTLEKIKQILGDNND